MMSSAAQPIHGVSKVAPALVVLTGNPNCGKTTLFNSLTGLRAKVGNYPGVTVERKEGRLQGAPKGRPVSVLDLPGAYSLTPQSQDEQIARDVLFHRVPEVPVPDVVVVVSDASNLQRNLYFATQVIELGYPTILALNMMDVARENGHEIEVPLLEEMLGVPVVPLVASTGEGIPELRRAILRLLEAKGAPGEPRRFCDVPELFAREAATLGGLLQQTFPETRFQSVAEAILLLGDEKFMVSSGGYYPPVIRESLAETRRRLEQQGIDWRSAAIERRYACVAAIEAKVARHTVEHLETVSDRLDRVLTHRVWGGVILMAVLAVVFQSIFSLAKLPMEGLEHGVKWLGDLVGGVLAAGPLRSLLVDGIIAGVGAVIVFLPQICLLFMFIGLLEDTGYMARAAFLMDRLMSRVGLHGKSFIPMLSSFACAIPGIMATRTIENPRDRLVTILVAPLMSCSARLPVYTLLIAACIPDRRLFGVVHLPGLTLLAMYLLGIVVALMMAWLFKRTLLKGPTPMLIMELPPYKRPLLRVVLRHMWDRSRVFIHQAGTVILGINILLWFLASYPKSSEIEKRYDLLRAQAATAAVPDDSPVGREIAAASQARLNELEAMAAGERLGYSFAGRLGHLLEPVLAPLGFDWKIGIGILSSFAAREVFVSTMSLVYSVGEMGDDDSHQRALKDTLLQQKRPDGTLVYSPLVGIALMVFYVFALQCGSTIAVVRRETNSWRWPLFQWAYLALLAWGFAFLTYQGGRLLGWG